MFHPGDHEIGRDDAEQFKNGLNENASKMDIEAFVGFRMIVYESNRQRKEKFFEDCREDFDCVSENQFNMIGDIRQEIR